MFDKDGIIIEFKDGFDNMNFDKVTELLANEFWTPGIKKNEILKGAENSALLVGAFVNGVQIAYARVISDKTRFAYILDVVVNDKYRKQGIGQKMINYILEYPDMQDVYQWLLITKDAHEVYKKVGFEIMSRPNDWMEIRTTRPDR
jgi:N-acetylglutamate synthase-like GNAT family acetyltransferase